MSESGERMVVCIRSENSAVLEALCASEGLECAMIAKVTDGERFSVKDRDGKVIASLTRDFLMNGGAEKHLSAQIEKCRELPISPALEKVKASLEKISPIKKLFGHTAKYDYNIGFKTAAKETASLKCEYGHVFNRAVGGSGAGIDLMAGETEVSVRELSYCGKPLTDKNGTKICSVVSCGNLPGISGLDPYKGAYLAVGEAVMKLVASGYGDRDIRLTLQEYFPEHKNSSKRIGMSVAAMLGAFEAQMQLSVPSLGGRISIVSGSKEYENTASVTAFAFCTGKREDLVGDVLTNTGSRIVLMRAETTKNSVLPGGEALTELIEEISSLSRSGKIISMKCVNARTPATVLMEMCKVNKKGVKFAAESSIDSIFGNSYLAVIAELANGAEMPKRAELLGYVTDDYMFTGKGDGIKLSELLGTEEEKSPVKHERRSYLYLKNISDNYGKVKPVEENKVKVLICQTKFTVPQNEVKYAFEKLGAEVKVFPLSENNITEFVKKLKKTDILWLGNGISSHSFLTSVLSEKRVRAEISAIEERKGLLKNIEADNDLAMNFVPDHHKHLITAKGVSLAYDKLPLFQPTTFDLMRGHQIVITGKNGIGKSSLFKAITNTFAGTITGKLHSADKISISYLSQIEQSNNLSLKDFAQKHHLNYADFLNILHKLGTERDIFTNSINQMSSGQQKKVYLAKSLLEPANLYLWDEPLNYLDVFNQEQIIQLIKKYHPTMLVIEHDQRFIDELGAQVIHLT